MASAGDAGWTLGPKPPPHLEGGPREVVGARRLGVVIVQLRQLVIQQLDKVHLRHGGTANAGGNTVVWIREAREKTGVSCDKQLSFI